MNDLVIHQVTQGHRLHRTVRALHGHDTFTNTIHCVETVVTRTSEADVHPRLDQSRLNGFTLVGDVRVLTLDRNRIVLAQNFRDRDPT